MKFYIDLNGGGYIKFAGEGMSMAGGMAEVTEDVFNQHVLDIDQSSYESLASAIAEKEQALNVLVDRLVLVTELTEEQVRAAL